MFLDDTSKREPKKGWIEVICGSMFSGKTEELIRRLRRSQIAGQKVEIFKPKMDTRYAKVEVVSHDKNSIPSLPVDSSTDILLKVKEFDVVGVDEAQFFDEKLPDVCDAMANQGIRVIVAGLDMDFAGQPFGPMPELMARAEYVTKVHAICMNCGRSAVYSYRKTDQDELVVLGEEENYAPLCRSCYNAQKQLNPNIE
ncbi:MAG: thymidine kinase [Flavobacteriales bacterium]|nr:thymidine kinase [Flavobacteriales bacterium]NNK81049.1 thymidine kinase [Flavobacteriales bacterium]